MTTIKAIIFDAGGVVIDPGKQLDEFTTIFKPKNKQKFWEKINHHLGPLCTGKMSEEKFWTIIAKSENFDPEKVPPNLWVKNYEKTNKINKRVVEFIKELRNKYKTILVSNTISPHVQVNRRRGVFDHFDDVLNSNEVGLSKDTSEIFKLVLKRNRLRAEECIFIDDIQKFVNVAGSLGIRGILFKNIGQLKKDLAGFGATIR
jgi:putative hydrolase of the HAD superfamily